MVEESFVVEIPRFFQQGGRNWYFDLLTNIQRVDCQDQHISTVINIESRTGPAEKWVDGSQFPRISSLSSQVGNLLYLYTHDQTINCLLGKSFQNKTNTKTS